MKFWLLLPLLAVITNRLLLDIISLDAWMRLTEFSKKKKTRYILVSEYGDYSIFLLGLAPGVL